MQRILFLAFAFRSLRAAPWPEILATNLHAIPMDLSATGYILMASALLSSPLLFRELRWVRRGLVVWTLALLMLSALLNVTDIGLFEAWGSKLDRKALSYLAFPKEAAASVPLSGILLLLTVAVAQVIAFWTLFRRLDQKKEFNTGGSAVRWASVVAATVLGLMAARGGPQDDPINKSWAYFSRHNVLNLAALNSVWNALEIAVTPTDVEINPYTLLTPDEAKRIFNGTHSKGIGDPRSILKTERPNILIIMLESWTADIIEPLGGDSGVAPQFTRLAKNGLLLTNFYSTGFRTEQGLCAVLSGFPAQPKTTIIRNFGKFDRLPSIVRELGGVGYSSSYWYAGNVEFANTRAYLEAMGFDHVYSDGSFPISKRTEWGAFDEELFAFHLREAGKDKRPFFHMLITSTSHEPFDAPVNEGFPGRSDPQLYRNTVHYTDRCLGDFMDKSVLEDWYTNTLVVIVADHGHYLPHFLDQSSAARHHIPFLITGGALRDDLHGKTDTTYASHVDLAATLLAQLAMDRNKFEWSQDIFDPTVPHSAFWTFNEGFGIADSSQIVVMDAISKRTTELRDSSRTADRDRLLRNGKAQLQLLLDQYIGFNQ